MSWATGRRALIIGGMVVVLLLIAGAFAYSVLHPAPSCVDGKQNQDEEGVDCGGICTYLCTASLDAPIVSFARELTTAGRTDVIAYVENPNSGVAAKGVGYTVELYSADRVLLASKSGTVDIPPREYGPTPVYLSNLYAGDAVAAQAFLSFDDATFKWFSPQGAFVTPVPDSPVIGGTPDSPRVIATFQNPSVETIRKAKVIATVFDAAGNAIAASQTVLPDLGPDGSADAIFTWNEPFAAPVVRIDVRALIPVSAP